MTLPVFFTIKLLIASVLLFGFYLLLFKDKASFIASRIFLLAIPILSLIFSVSSIESSPFNFSLSEMIQKMLVTEDKASANSKTPEMTITTYIGSKNLKKETTIPIEHLVVDMPEGEGVIQEVNTNYPAYALFIFIYISAVIILLLLLIRQVRGINRISRNAHMEHIDNIPIYYNSEISRSFSFMRQIYIQRNLSDDKLELILEHELSHIRCYHYIDLIALEVATILMWFNPIIWLIRKELRAVHEFQVDAKVINKGIKVREYMQAILEEATGNIPSLANGLQGSLIKKRFMNMKHEHCIKLETLRKVLTIPFLIVLFIFFSCSTQEQTSSENPYELKVKKHQKANNNIPVDGLFEVRNSSGEFELYTKEELKEVMKDIKTLRIKGLPPTRVVAVYTDGSYIKDISEEFPLDENNKEDGVDLAHHNLTLGADNSWINPDGVALTDWTRDWVVRHNAKAITNKRKFIPYSPVYDDKNNRILRIEANDKETRITFATTSYWDWCWRFTDKNTCLIDKETGDRYMIRDIEGDEEVGRLSILEGTNGMWFENTNIFPPLKKGVVSVDYYSPSNFIDAPINHNGTGTHIPNIAIRKHSGEIIR